MRVDFDSLRKQLAENYNGLVQTLNKSQAKVFSATNKDGKEVKGDMVVDSNDIKTPLENLTNIISTIVCCYNGNDVGDISDEVDTIESFL